MSPAFRPGSLLDRAFGSKEERALGPQGTFIYGHTGIPALFRPEESLEAYDHNVWLYRSVLTISMEMARVQLRLQDMSSKTDVKYVERHQAIETMSRPQETKTGKCQLSGMSLRIVTGMHMMLNGEGFWIFNKRLKSQYGGAPTYIDLSLPASMRLKLDQDDEIEKYLYRKEYGNELELDPLDVVHFKIPDQKNWLRGHSPVQAIRYAVDTQRKADITNTKKLDNNAVPAGTLESENGLTPEQRKQIGDAWRQEYGGTGNAGKVAFLPNGLKFNPIQESNRDMQFVEGKGVTRDEILANYGMGLEILGQTDSVTRSNAEATIFVFQKYGVLPFLELFVDTLNNDYLPAFPGTENLKFVLPPDVVPENMEEKRLTADNLANGGALTPNERRKMFGLEPLDLPGMDSTYIPFSLSPIGEPTVAPNAPVN